jgi:hypothetical protein
MLTKTLESKFTYDATEQRSHLIRFGTRDLLPPYQIRQDVNNQPPAHFRIAAPVLSAPSSAYMGYQFQEYLND